jgi:hypothetical protein
VQTITSADCWFSLPVHDVTVLRPVSSGMEGLEAPEVTNKVKRVATVTHPNHASTNALGQRPRGLGELPIWTSRFSSRFDGYPNPEAAHLNLRVSIPRKEGEAEETSCVVRGWSVM